MQTYAPLDYAVRGVHTHCSFGIFEVGGMEPGVCDRPNLALLGETTIPNRPVISILLADAR